MKTILSALLFAAIPFLGTGCSTTKQAAALSATTAIAGTVATDAALLPAALVAKVQALVSAHPGVEPYLVTVANGLESIANVEAKLPSPNSTEATLIEWTAGNIPGVGSYVTDLVGLYKEFYPAIAPTGAALSELAEVVRSSVPAA